MKIAANLSLLFTQVPLRERIRLASAAGFDGVEIQFPYELPAIVLQEELTRCAVPLVLINLPAGDLMQGGAGLAAVPSRQAEFAQALEQALSYAAMTRPRWVNVLPGRLAEGVSFEQAQHCLIANLRRAAEAFARLGIGVTCEAINSLDMPGFLISNSTQLRALIEAVDHPNCKAQLDLYHMARQGLEPSECIAQLAGQIGHVQFADCPGRHQPGSGQIDFEAALAALKLQNYSGWLAAEYHPNGDTQASLGWLKAWQAI